MTTLTIYPEDAASPTRALHDHAAIRAALAAIGVVLEQWEACAPLPPGASNEQILAAYQGSIDRLTAQHGFKQVDVVSVAPDHPQREAMRSKFLAEHTHADFEVRFFVAGSGLFCLHADGKVYAVRCETGDLISVPAGMRHWFDMGPRPSFTAIRLFTTPEGWVAEFTGDPIADRFPRHE